MCVCVFFRFSLKHITLVSGVLWSGGWSGSDKCYCNCYCYCNFVVFQVYCGLVAGLAVTALTTIFHPVSGGHFNPGRLL